MADSHVTDIQLNLYTARLWPASQLLQGRAIGRYFYCREEATKKEKERRSQYRTDCSTNCCSNSSPSRLNGQSRPLVVQSVPSGLCV